jgi:hypothetical protein
MISRKGIFPVQKLSTYDIKKLLKECNDLNLFDRNIWHSINFGSTKDKEFLELASKHSEYYSKWFAFKTNQYQDLFLNELDYELINSYSDESFDSMRSRVKVITNGKKLRTQRNAEFIFKPLLKQRFQHTYLEQVIKDVGSKFPGGWGRVKIGFMGACTDVKEHIDADSKYILKVHIPLITDSKVIFRIKYKNDTISQHMNADGSSYLLNVGLPHSVENYSNIDRYHLIINVYNSINDEV